MKTLFWSGCVTQSALHGQCGIWRWFNYYRQHKEALGVTHWAVFNDGSENLPIEWIVSTQDASKPLAPLAADRLNLIHQAPHLGRKTTLIFPGFWRNLLSAIRVCQEQNFDRFILVEWDCFIIGADMLFEIGTTRSGLTSYWCPSYGIPESAIVVCGRDRFERTREQAMALQSTPEPTDQDRFEVAMDWTEVRKNRVGDRYAEMGRSFPLDAEFVCQVPIHAQLAWGNRIEVMT